MIGKPQASVTHHLCCSYVIPDACCGLHKSLQVKDDAEVRKDGSEEDQLALESLSMEQVLQNGTPLLASGGQVWLQHRLIRFTTHRQT